MFASVLSASFYVCWRAERAAIAVDNEEQMKNHLASVIAAAVGLVLSAGAPAQTMSHADYKTRYEAIAAQSKAGQAACRSFAGNIRDICLAKAKGSEAVAQAELKAAYEPGGKSRYDVSITRAQADYRIAREKCDDKSGNAKDVCIEEAWTAQVSADADARSQLRASSTSAPLQPDPKAVEVRDQESEKTRAAAFAATKARCDTYAGDAKARCLKSARQR